MKEVNWVSNSIQYYMLEVNELTRLEPKSGSMIRDKTNGRNNNRENLNDFSEQYCFFFLCFLRIVRATVLHNSRGQCSHPGLCKQQDSQYARYSPDCVWLPWIKDWPCWHVTSGEHLGWLGIYKWIICSFCVLVISSCYTTRVCNY